MGGERLPSLPPSLLGVQFFMVWLQSCLCFHSIPVPRRPVHRGCAGRNPKADQRACAATSATWELSGASMGKGHVHTLTLESVAAAPMGYSDLHLPAGPSEPSIRSKPFPNQPASRSRIWNLDVA